MLRARSTRMRMRWALVPIALAAGTMAGCGADPPDDTAAEVDAAGDEDRDVASDGPEVLVFLAPGSESTSVRDRLAAHPDVTSVVWVDPDVAFEEFTCLFADQEDLLASVTPEVLPASFRIHVSGDRDQLFEEIRTWPGVRDVVWPIDLEVSEEDAAERSAWTQPSRPTTPAEECREAGERIK